MLNNRHRKPEKVVKLCKNYDPPKQAARDARFTRRTPSQTRFENQKPALRYKRARYYHAQLGRFISRDPLGFVDGMSLYRAYFVPGGADALGLSTFQKCLSDCIHNFLVHNTDFYMQNPGKVDTVCRKWCGGKFPLPPPVIILDEPKSTDSAETCVWQRTGGGQWTDWKLISSDDCFCKYEAKVTEEWRGECSRTTKNPLKLLLLDNPKPIDWIETDTTITIATKVIYKIGECSKTLPWEGPREEPGPGDSFND